MATTTLQDYVGAADGDTEFVNDCQQQATALVTEYIGTTEVPDDVRARAVLEVGAELFHRRSTKNGVAQFATPDGSPVRVARDPMVAAYPILNRYVSLGIA